MKCFGHDLPPGFKQNKMFDSAKQMLNKCKLLFLKRFLIITLAMFSSILKKESITKQ